MRLHSLRGRPSRAALAAAAVASACMLGVAADARACDLCDGGWGPATDGFGFEERLAQYRANGGLGGLANYGGPTPIVGTQQVWLDFSQQIGGTYSAAEQQQILAGLQSIYAAFDYSFSLTPPSGQFTTLIWDSGSGGLADEIDFRNLNASNTAFVGTSDVQGLPSAQQVNFAVNVGAHELGHTVGLRHHDSYGPIGSGVPNSGVRSAFLPDFPGPLGAVEHSGNVMSTPAQGANPNVFFNTRAVLSERSVMKLAFNEQGVVTNEIGSAHGTIGTAQALTMQKLNVPNLRPAGSPYFGEIFDVETAVVLGNMTTSGELDVYSFIADEGDLISIEVMGSALDRITDFIDSTVNVRDSAGVLLDYFGSTAQNDDEDETTDSFILDLLIPEDGTYFVSVDNPFTNFSGNYELYIASFNVVVPEPGTFGVLAVSGLLLLRRR